MLLHSKMKRSLKRLASKVKSVNNNGSSRGGSLSPEEHESLSGLSIKSFDSDTGVKAKGGDKNGSSNGRGNSSRRSPGCFAVYVGEERERFMVKTSYLMHPLLKMLLEKSSNEFGFERRDVLVVPCSVLAFQEALNAIQMSHGRFDFGELVEEFL